MTGWKFCPALVAAAALLTAAPALAAPVGFDFSLLPADGSISGAPGETIGWGYVLSNNTVDWLLVAALDADAFEHGSASAAPFDFPILAPGASVSVAYNGASGLYELNWDGDAPIGFVNSGVFVLMIEFYDDDPLSGGALLGAVESRLNYRATVKDGGVVPVPEPGSLALLVLGVASMLRRARSQRLN